MADNFSATTHSVEEMQQWFVANKQNIENFAMSNDAARILRDVTQGIDTRSISTIDKEAFIGYIKNIASNEKKIRDTSRYLFYRSNIYFRIVMWYATMFCLDARMVTPQYSLTKSNNNNSILQSYEKTLNYLDILNNQGNLLSALINVFVDDVYFAIRFSDDNGTFYYPLDVDECIIDGMYSDGSYSFAVNMAKWNTKKRKAIIEYLGSPLTEMFREWESTKAKYIHMPDQYSFCLKFHTDTWDMNVPPLLPIFLSLANISDLEQIQADADELNIYKLLYLPMETKSNSKNINDFDISPEIKKKYFKKMLDDGVVPAKIGAAIIPGSELKVIDFSDDATSDTTSVSKAQDQILATAGGGAVINANNITSSEAFKSWLKSETEFAISSLLPQIDGITNRYLSFELGKNACNVRHFPISVYTQKDYAEQFLTANQYGYSYRLAYGTLINVKELETLAMLELETNILNLPNIMKYPLSSSFTSSSDNEDEYTSEIGQGAPTKDPEIDGLTDSGERDRNR